MSCLSDKSIRNEQYGGGDLVKLITPFSEDCVQPASYELTFDGSCIYRAKELGSVYCFYEVAKRRFHAPKDYDPWDKAEDFERITIEPGRFYIASSREYLRIPAHLMARFEGKSSMGRIGLMVHITAGYIDPGFEGNLTLEIVNVAPWPIVLRDGDKIGQLSFHLMDQVPDKLYGNAGNHYQGQTGPTLPR